MCEADVCEFHAAPHGFLCGAGALGTQRLVQDSVQRAPFLWGSFSSCHELGV